MITIFFSFLHITAYKYSWSFWQNYRFCLTPKLLCYIKIHTSLHSWLEKVGYMKSGKEKKKERRKKKKRKKHHSTQFFKQIQLGGGESRCHKQSNTSFSLSQCQVLWEKFAAIPKSSVQRRYQGTTTILSRKKKNGPISVPGPKLETNTLPWIIMESW